MTIFAGFPLYLMSMTIFCVSKIFSESVPPLKNPDSLIIKLICFDAWGPYDTTTQDGLDTTSPKRMTTTGEIILTLH